jgi:hypothetical protein
LSSSFASEDRVLLADRASSGMARALQSRFSSSENSRSYSIRGSGSPVASIERVASPFIQDAFSSNASIGEYPEGKSRPCRAAPTASERDRFRGSSFHPVRVDAGLYRQMSGVRPRPSHAFTTVPFNQES